MAWTFCLAEIPPTPEEAQKVRELGGLHVIGTERNEARRIDNQLRGRAGRQGDQGSSQFFLSLEDDLLRIFGGDRIKGMMERFDLPTDEPIEFSFVSKAVAQAQEKVEGANFDMRKHLLEYDDVLNKQRAAIYKRRREILYAMNVDDVEKIIYDASSAALEAMQSGIVLAEEEIRDPEAATAARTKNWLIESGIVKSAEELPGDIGSLDEIEKLLKTASHRAAEHPLAKNQLLGILDMLWMTNLEDLEALQESVGLRSYAQRDPLVEYRQEASRLFRTFWGNFNGWVFMNIFKLATSDKGQVTRQAVTAPSMSHVTQQHVTKVGRNDPCPCGSGKKWKHCGLLNTEEHQKRMRDNPHGVHEVTGG